MARNRRQKELNMLYKLGKCRKCPFLQITDVEYEKVYCFYKVCNLCVNDLFDRKKVKNENSRKKY